VEPNIPPERVNPNLGVDQLLEALRRDTERLAPDAGSALTFRPDPEPAE
jgi:hypothetical protein